MEFKLLFLTIIFMKFLSIKGACNEDEKSKSVYQQIMDNILCNYDKYIRPTTLKSNKTDVSIYFQLVTMEYLDTSATMKLTTWINLFWVDPKLHWDPKLYQNTKFIDVAQNILWVPDIVLYNWVDEHPSLENLYNTFLTHNGLVFAATKITLNGHCVPDFTKWPFDEHTCEFVLLSKQYYGHQMDFVIYAFDRLTLTFYIPHPEWELLEHSAKRNETSYNKSNPKESYAVAITLTLKIKRHASVLIASYVIPAFALVVLSMAVFWLSPVSSQRLVVICVLVILQALYLQYLAFEIHSNGNTTPRIVQFYSGSLILSSILFILTVSTRCMVRWSSKPSWLQSLSNLILTNRIIQIILLSESDPKAAAAVAESGEDEGLTLVSKTDGRQQWHMFADIINRAVFFLILPIYIFLFVHFII